MKINNVSFGTTYLTPSLRCMSPENREKIKSVYSLGQIYPVDLYLGSDKKGDLTLQIKRGSMYDYLLKNNYIEPTKNNIAALKIIKAADAVNKYIHGDSSPVRKVTIKELDYIPEDILPYYVADEIEEFNKTYSKKFDS